jgi:hypothetical protein
VVAVHRNRSGADADAQACQKRRRIDHLEGCMRIESLNPPQPLESQSNT